jgi:hypothetical protein
MSWLTFLIGFVCGVALQLWWKSHRAAKKKEKSK